MLYAILSDIHANLQAWKAVQEDIVRLGVDEVVCLGDIVGYGPDPDAVVESVIANTHHCVLGNHDAAVAGKLRADRFNRDSRAILEWTRDLLGPGAVRYLEELPLVIGGESFACAHADVSEPALFRYIYQPLDAKHCWGCCEDQIIFIGHTHIPSIHMVGDMGVPHYLPPQDLRCNRQMRYVVNVGSVGQSRDGNLDACYCVYDTDKDRIYFRRVAWDIDAHLNALAAVGIPPHPCLLEGQLANPQEHLRHMEFRPLGSDDPDQGKTTTHASPVGTANRTRPVQKPNGRQRRNGALTTSRHAPVRNKKPRGRGRAGRPARRGKRSVRIAASRRRGSSFTLMLILGGLLLFGLLFLVIILATRKSAAQAGRHAPAPSLATAAVRHRHST